jgi:hypothetical protein
LVIRSALLYRVAIWSLEADERGQRHAIKLLQVLQNSRLTVLEVVARSSPHGT